MLFYKRIEPKQITSLLLLFKCNPGPAVGLRIVVQLHGPANFRKLGLGLKNIVERGNLSVNIRVISHGNLHLSDEQGSLSVGIILDAVHGKS